MTERIVVGMSGGVDSSVAAALLVEQGYDVVGITMRVEPRLAMAESVKRFGNCCGTEAVEDARAVARALGIRYYLLSMEEEFNQKVISSFIDEYAAGRTPVPCVACNSNLKFGSLLGRARAWDAAAVATGHYARVERDPTTGRYLLLRAKDVRKDQTDFLWPLTQAQLGAARFPVGELTKDEVREHARRLGLVTADKPESQDICFVPDDDYRGFLRRRAPEVFRPGAIVDQRGRVLGTHGGIAAYTVGQKRGLGLATGRPLYVVDLDPERNTVSVGEAPDLERDRLVATAVNFIAGEPPKAPLRVEAKIRHSHRPAAATVRALDGDRAEVIFDAPQRAVSPGQSVVFYSGDVVVGGGVIARPASR
ncbi:MAG: tRNA 2-thiouridine(34) synthase MnmA [Candidatus Rokuibacteriota bacterium]|nr:MAG: tRNA 2-thiouridine(34) synthase MnmA [Candidatus Rokubacteria bacterium]